jgi:hypothetical protein
MPEVLLVLMVLVKVAVPIAALGVLYWLVFRRRR